MKEDKNHVRPLVAMELRSDGSVAACLPDFSVIKLSYEQCLAIHQMLRPYLKFEDMADFVYKRQFPLLGDERQVS